MESCLELHKKYLEGFNNHDIEAVKKYNDEKLETYFMGNLMAGSLADVLPAYISDFEMNEQAKVIKGPVETIYENECHIDIELLAVQKKKIVEMTYIFGKDKKMIKHLCKSVRDE
jgi:hypothetical protein